MKDFKDLVAVCIRKDDKDKLDKFISEQESASPILYADALHTLLSIYEGLDRWAEKDGKKITLNGEVVEL